MRSVVGYMKPVQITHISIHALEMSTHLLAHQRYRRLVCRGPNGEERLFDEENVFSEEGLNRDRPRQYSLRRLGDHMEEKSERKTMMMIRKAFLLPCL